MSTPGLFGVPWLVWTGVCLVVAAVYVVVWPRPKGSAPAWRRLLLRWAHAVVWLALAGSCLVRAASGPSLVADALAQGAAVVYATFLGTVVISRARPPS
jgi:drug/metabolite transporter (DMT)-like permease